MLNQLNNLVRVANFVVVPADELDELVGQSDTSLSVEDRRAGVAEEVARYDIFVGVAEDTLEFTFGSLLDSFADLCVGSRR